MTYLTDEAKSPIPVNVSTPVLVNHRKASYSHCREPLNAVHAEAITVAAKRWAQPFSRQQSRYCRCGWQIESRWFAAEYSALLHPAEHRLQVPPFLHVRQVGVIASRPGDFDDLHAALRLPCRPAERFQEHLFADQTRA